MVRYEHMGGTCPACRQQAMFARYWQVPDHGMHLILSVITAGLWLPVWAFLAVSAAAGPWICLECGQALPYEPKSRAPRPAPPSAPPKLRQ